MKYIFLIITLLFIGCKNSSNSDKNTSQENKQEIEVFTIGPVLNALVKDANNQVAVFDKNSSKYIFENPIVYPINVTPTSQTFIDIDYDKNKTATDLKPNFTNLKSFTNQINLLTNLYYSNEYNDSNITISTYTDLIKNRFNIDILTSPTQNEEVAKVLFASYNYSLENNLTKLEDIDNKVDEINLFFNNYLSTLDINKTKYYSFYDSLINLDKKRITRTDTLHKPTISILRDSITYTNESNDVDVFDIYIKPNVVYTASGHEELALFDSSLVYKKHSNVDLLSFGIKLYPEKYNNSECLFLADSNYGFKVFDSSTNDITQKEHILSYISSDNKEENFTSNKVLSINGYISSQNSKRLLAISTNDKGFYLVNIKDNFTNCSLNQDINSSTMLITADNTQAISSSFRNDGAYLYVSTKDNITGYSLDILDSEKIATSKTTYSIQNSEEAYNTMLINNDNELFVTTNKGIQIYDVDNSNNLSFISEYTTEGANTGYYPRIDFYNNYLFFTDGYKGLKVIKYDDSFTPMLCGVEYFAPKNNSEELAKVNSVKYNDGYLYVGIDSYGIVKFKFQDILFKHCKE